MNKNDTIFPDGPLAVSTEPGFLEFLFQFIYTMYDSMHGFDEIASFFYGLSVIVVSMALLYIIIGLSSYVYSDKGQLMMIRDYEKRVLFITAHPADECLYFGPSIMRLKQEGCQIFLLCLTPGGYPDARIMKQELYESCGILGIPRSNITITRCTELPDIDGAMWNASFLAPKLHRYVDTHSIHEIYTFDHVGVNYNPNHCSIFYALARLRLKQRLDATVFFLESVNRVRKWSFVCDTCLSWSSFEHKWIADLFITYWKDSSRIKRALSMYRTNWNRDRMIHADLCRYMYINSYRLMSCDDIHLILQMTDYQYFIG